MVRAEHGDMREVLRRLIDDGVRVQSIVTDPPYHLTTGKKGGSGEASLNVSSPAGRARISTGFMGKAWDGGDVAFQLDTWRLCWEILPPGGHLLAFGGTRTYHRLVCAIEDAGFEIRESLAYIYGSGFPKSHNVSRKLRDEEKCCACVAPLPSVRRRLDTKDEVSGGPQQDMLAGLQRQVDFLEEAGADQEAAKRARVLLRAGRKCEGCGEEATQVHHLTYEHVFEEFLFELIAVCRGCHERLHDHGEDEETQ